MLEIRGRMPHNAERIQEECKNNSGKMQNVSGRMQRNSGKMQNVSGRMQSKARRIQQNSGRMCKTRLYPQSIFKLPLDGSIFSHEYSSFAQNLLAERKKPIHFSIVHNGLAANGTNSGEIRPGIPAHFW
jgi:hypothetical protein